MDMPVRISNIKLREYLLLKNNNEYAINYCYRYFTHDAGREVTTLFRSIDDVDYFPVTIPNLM